MSNRTNAFLFGINGFAGVVNLVAMYGLWHQGKPFTLSAVCATVSLSLALWFLLSIKTNPS